MALRKICLRPAGKCAKIHWSQKENKEPAVLKERCFRFKSGGKDAEIICFWNMEMMKKTMWQGAVCMLNTRRRFCGVSFSYMLSKVGRFLSNPPFLMRRPAWESLLLISVQASWGQGESSCPIT